MACLDMYNSEHKGHHCAPMSPRISFSNDFVDTQLVIKPERSSREAPVSSDFEFCVSNYSMMSADELFFKGRLLPFKDNCNNQMQRTTTTLREELLAGDEDEDKDFSQRPPKGSTRWKGLLGLKRSHIGSKKLADKSDGSVGRVIQNRRSGLVHEATQQEMLNEGGSSCRDVEIGI
ncbi:SKI/DACH domain-containing protein 1 [Quillaja saponaria]|uniref:SKI/DACH domain-containing protein 1 n=1 Tax=Quillaja saponaria TaxID=32244 RepID=A0AAD7L763_QUISA|nr:SKI/DACH domain-containing protein 1 [Quillaja saponaria]